jgi:hypothetical protein
MRDRTRGLRSKLQIRLRRKQSCLRPAHERKAVKQHLWRGPRQVEANPGQQKASRLPSRIARFAIEQTDEFQRPAPCLGALAALAIGWRRMCSLRTLLSKSWIGPAISLVILATSLAALMVSVRSYHRQGNRWPAEGARIAPKPDFSIGRPSVDGWSIGTLSVTNRLSVGLWLEKVQVIEPNDLHIAPQISIGDSSPDLHRAGDHIDLHQVVPPPTPNSTQTFGIWSGSFYAKPAKDGEVITLQFELRDPDYPRTWRIDVSSTVHKQQ